MIELEKKLAAIHGRKYCILTGSGTCAIYLALKSKNYTNKIIALPNNACINVVLAVLFSGNKPLFLDVEDETFGINIELIKQYRIDAIIAVHAYGNICNIEHIAKYAYDNDIFLIEDAALAQGAKLNNRVIGSFGDISVLSFGSGKNIDIGHGGALLTDNEDVYSLAVNENCKLNYFNSENEKVIENISKAHTKLYNIDYGKNLLAHKESFYNLCINGRQYFLYKFSDEYLDKLDFALTSLEKLLLTRQQNALYLKNIFKDFKAIKIFEPKFGSTFWRFNIFIKTNRDILFSYLLSKKYKVSSWNHSLDKLFDGCAQTKTPISDYIDQSIINIWVNEDISKTYLEDISSDIISFIKNIENE